MPKLLWSFVVAALICFSSSDGYAGILPVHDDVCNSKIVSKKLLANYILELNDNKFAKKMIFGDATLWRLIFVQEPEQFCTAEAVCKRKKLTGKDCADEIKTCTSAQDLAVGNAGELFDELTLETAKTKATYIEDPTLVKASSGARARTYFATDDDNKNAIICTVVPTPGPPPPDAIEKSQFRVRGISDDLFVERGNADAFKSTSQATLTSTGDRAVAHNQTLKAKAALGYAIPINGMTTAIPYFSFSQSITDTFGKPQSTDPTNNVAAGMLFSSSVSNAVLNSVFGAKPQYLLNTKDHSEIGSLRLTYTPYTYFPGDVPNLNFFQPVSFSPIPLYAEILFDLRLDAGTYQNRGNDPVQRLLNKDYVRSGTRAGLAFTTDSNPNAPSFTLVVAETYLYGFSGTVRDLNIFEASLTYNFNKYLGLTGAYRNGKDEDTAIRVETWTVGLSGRF